MSQVAVSRSLAALADRLRAVVGEDGVVASPHLRAVYECDGYTLERSVPDLVVLPRSPEAAAAAVARITEAGFPLVPRGAGTGLAGGCLAEAGAVVVALSRMRRVEVLDPESRQALVQAGVVNRALSRAAEPAGLAYAPDPSSQEVCTLGGNIANNSGGPHTLKEGVTSHHVLAVELVTPDGMRRWLGSRIPARGGPDLAGLAVGSEGTFGIVTRAWVRLVAPPPAARTLLAHFGSVAEASRAVTDIIASGIVPAAVEMMDALIQDALTRAFGLSFPPGTEAVLLVEVDGLEAGLDAEAERAAACCRRAGARSVRWSADETERQQLWIARKRAFGAIGRLSRNYCTQDGVVPRTRLPEILEFIQEVGRRSGLRIANVFHAGDGNLHPVLLYEEDRQGEMDRVLEASAAILERCLDLGGSLTGEHGIGVEKLALMDRAFTPETLEVMNTVRGVFDPRRLANPGKAVPAGGGCSDPPGALRALGRVRPGRKAAM